MMKLKEIQNLFHKELDTIFGKNETDTFFYLLLEEYCQLKPFTLALTPNLMATNTQETSFFKALSNLKLEKPIQQILEKTTFCDLVIAINKHVLIPRPETEELVYLIQESYSKEAALKILDIGTGSGCIAVALAKHFELAKVSAIDISDAALELAAKNAKSNEVNVEFIKSDILTTHSLERTGFDIIVSNPPYVRISEKQQMKKNVLNYEPHLALFVEDEDALVFYKKITALAVDNLTPNGMLFFEINQYLSQSMKALLEQHKFMDIVIKNDFYGNPRMIKGSKV